MSTTDTFAKLKADKFHWAAAVISHPSFFDLHLKWIFCLVDQTTSKVSPCRALMPPYLATFLSVHGPLTTA